MSKPTKAQQIADHLNAFYTERPYDYTQIAEAKAVELNVGLYWAGTAAPEPKNPTAEVWQMNEKNEWTRKLGEVVLGHDNVWRA